jgi:hypothetical protein
MKAEGRWEMGDGRKFRFSGLRSQIFSFPHLCLSVFICGYNLGVLPVLPPFQLSQFLLSAFVLNPVQNNFKKKLTPLDGSARLFP